MQRLAEAVNESDEPCPHGVESRPDFWHVLLDVHCHSRECGGELSHLSNDGVVHGTWATCHRVADRHLTNEARDRSPSLVGTRAHDLALGGAKADERRVYAAWRTGSPLSDHGRVLSIGHRLRWA